MNAKNTNMERTAPRLIDLPKIPDPRGNLSFIEDNIHLPFKIRRVYWIYDVPGGEVRGGHAFKEQQEMIVALSGSFDIVVTDGKVSQDFSLNRSYYGLYLPAGFWRQMQNFSTNSLAMVLSSTYFNPDDYIYDFKQFQSLREANE
jgi:dTDP-4-dehydrorhamnose 3,5-epimerase-like enzyme